jgi:hypothetical protein
MTSLEWIYLLVARKAQKVQMIFPDGSVGRISVGKPNKTCIHKCVAAKIFL